MLAMSQQNTHYFEATQATLVLIQYSFWLLGMWQAEVSIWKTYKLPEANYLSFRDFSKRRLFLFLPVRSNWLHWLH